MSAESPWGCAKCATLGPTCCQRCEVLVTAGDRHRIGEHTGQTDFWEFRAPPDPTYRDQDGDPNWLKWAFEPDGTRAVLKRPATGNCSFLALGGCALPIEVRPLVCRLYPYTYTQAGVSGVDAYLCPLEVVPPGSTLLKVLDMGLVDAVRWHGMLYSELETKEPCDANRADVRFAG
jgi:Fe-S-cluster containining protein